MLAVLQWTPAAQAAPSGSRQDQTVKLANAISSQGVRASQLAEQYDQAKLKLDDLDKRLAGAKAGISSTQAQLDQARGKIRELAVASYMRGGAIVELGLVLPQTTTDLTIQDVYAKSASLSTTKAVDALDQTHAQYVAQRSTLATAQQAATKALASLDAARKAAAAASAAETALANKPLGGLATLMASSTQHQVALPRSTSKASRSRVATPSFSANASAPPVGRGAGAAIAVALSQMGKPYVFGGGGPNVYDCSGLTAWAWGHAGHPLPHSSSAQYADTVHVSISQLQPGDLVFYGSPPHHVGIYVGGGRMIDALHSGTNVEYDSIYLESDLIGGGRVA
jgi:cell wall-associated NlpC family hydrolase